MSTKDKKDVPKLVEKCRHRFPNAEKSYVRAMIKAENPKLFDPKKCDRVPANVKQLTRYLKKSFDINRQVVHLKSEVVRANANISKLNEELLTKMRKNEELSQEKFTLEDELLTKSGKVEELNRRLKDADTIFNVLKILDTNEDFDKLRKFLTDLRDEKYEKCKNEEWEDEQEFIAKAQEEIEKEP